MLLCLLRAAGVWKAGDRCGSSEQPRVLPTAHQLSKPVVVLTDEGVKHLVPFGKPEIKKRLCKLFMVAQHVTLTVVKLCIFGLTFFRWLYGPKGCFVVK